MLNDATDASKSPEVARSPEIDVNTFTGQTNYYCLPLSKLRLDGIDSAIDIAEIKSSCDCVRASVVGYRHSPRMKDALRIDFVPEDAASTEMIPAKLAVEITITTFAGIVRTLTVNVLDTQVVATYPSSSRSCVMSTQPQCTSFREQSPRPIDQWGSDLNALPIAPTQSAANIATNNCKLSYSIVKTLFRRSER
ncbi:MAG: hypothetical protein R3C09_25830 [Pirellulaceae bacterium]